MKLRVCAVILDYFGAEKTKHSTLSLLGQDLETIYILDNSGSYNASAALQRVISELSDAATGVKIKILTAGQNLGFAKGVNFVLTYDRQSEAPHDYYLLLNNDAVAGPELVARMLAEFEKDASVALVAPRIVSDDPGREFGIWYHRYFGLLLSRPRRGRFHYFTGCCLLFPKDLVTDTGIFDESFFMYGEDVELGWRLTRQGKKMVCANDVCVRHDLGPSVTRNSFFYEYHMARSHLRLSFRTRLRAAELPILLIAKFTALACRAAIRSLRYGTITPFAAFLLALFPLRVEEVSNSDRNTMVEQ
jgi:hypothetical protein